MYGAVYKWCHQLRGEGIICQEKTLLHKPISWNGWQWRGRVKNIKKWTAPILSSLSTWKNITYMCLEHKSIPLKKQAWTIWFHLAPSICLATGAILSFNLSQAILAACKIEKNTPSTKIDKKCFNLVFSMQLVSKWIRIQHFFLYISR